MTFVCTVNILSMTWVPPASASYVVLDQWPFWIAQHQRSPNSPSGVCSPSCPRTFSSENIRLGRRRSLVDENTTNEPLKVVWFNDAEKVESTFMFRCFRESCLHGYLRFHFFFFCYISFLIETKKRCTCVNTANARNESGNWHCIARGDHNYIWNEWFEHMDETKPATTHSIYRQWRWATIMMTLWTI